MYSPWGHKESDTIDPFYWDFLRFFKNGEDLRDFGSKLYHKPGFQLPMILFCSLFFVI